MNILALPVVLPLILMAGLIFIRSHRVSVLVGIAGSAALFLLSLFLLLRVFHAGTLVLNMGGWEAPFGITLVADNLAVLMLTVTSLILLAISVYASGYLKEDCGNSRFYVFFFSLTMGLNGAFLTGDVFNLYVWFEVMLLSSFVLITYGCSKEQLQGGIKYLAMNLVGSLFFLAGVGLLYGKTGTLNIAQLAAILRQDDQAILLNTSAMLFFVAFGIKSALFPLHFWLPASYHTPNITITSLFAGLLTKVGVYALIRFFTLFFVQDQAFWHNFLLVIAGLTMVIGGTAATAQFETRRILSYHIISQIGYMIMGLGIYTPLGIAGAIFFTLHNMLAKTNTFLVSGIIARLKGSYFLKEVGGLYRESPLLAILFILPAFALAGIPPLSGFFAKFILIKAGIEDRHYLITAVAILTGLLTLYSMIKIWNEAFLKKQPGDSPKFSPDNKLRFPDVFPPAILSLAIILMGLFAGRVFEFISEAAVNLIDSSNYIQSVLGGYMP